MYALTLRHGSPSFLLKSIGAPAKIKVKKDIVIFENGTLPGYAKAIVLDNRLNCLCATYFCSDDVYYKKLPAASEFFILRINEISYNNYGKVFENNLINNKTENPVIYSACLLSSLNEFTFSAPKNAIVKTLELKFSKDFFLKQSGVNYTFEMIKEFMNCRYSIQNSDMSKELKNLFISIIGISKTVVVNMAVLRKKINLLLAIYFSDFKHELCKFFELQKIKISTDEVSRLLTVRKRLDNDSSPPSLDLLSKLAFMSGTSLKTKFKKMYGSTVFEYFQKRRMQKARILLLTHKYSVKEVGHQLGYINLSNFAIAFKKEFKKLPHEFIK